MVLAISYLCFLVALVSLCMEWQYRQRRYPPGPRPLPIIGNLYQIPRKDRWRMFKKWHDIYGPIISVYIAQRLMIVLGSHKCVHDLLDKRGALYSSRPEYLSEAVGSRFHVVALPYGQQWREYRHILNSFLNPRHSKSYRLLHDLETKQLVYDLLSTDDFAGCFHRYAASLTFALAYGKRLDRGDEYEVQEIDRIMRNILEKVDLPAIAFPILDYIPSVFAPWKRRTKQLSKTQEDFFVARLKEGTQTAYWNWSHEAVGARKAKGRDWKELAYVVGINYEAGSDTTGFVLEVFVMASLLHPRAVEKAQAELDSAIWLHLSGWDDIVHLPYLRAFVNEVLRWRPVVPGGIHHLATAQDHYMGYEIPKNTPIIPNHWSLEFDEDVFPDSEAFIPERWLQNRDLPSSAFGFGRRLCPGRNMAMNSLMLAMARMLWTFEFKPIYENGRKMVPNPWEMTQGISLRPQPFRVSLCPRSIAHRDIIEGEWRGCEKDIQVLMDRIKRDVS